jgi:hypothetical protein
MTISLCKHSFTVLPPASITRPGPCAGCGITWLAVQEELARQADTIRLRTAQEGTCRGCAKQRMLFSYQREQMPWEETEPPTVWLCIPCWGNAQECEEQTGFVDFKDLFANGTDEQLSRALRGAL